MKSFSKLVQQKRVKMLILCLVLFGLNFFRNRDVSATELTYIVKKDGDNLQPICITEGNERYEGIGWIYPFPEGENLPKEDHHFLPTIKNPYNCKFSYNEQCTKLWSMKYWQVDTNTSRRFHYISDERWEDLPTHLVSKKTKNVQNRVEIPSVFKLGFSIRASDSVELLLCEGWDPRKYPCYQFNITSNRLRLSRYNTMSENDVNKANILDKYQVPSSNIITRDEWRNFEISMNNDGKIKLLDIRLNRTISEIVEKSPLKPEYLFFLSEQPSLWKIHQNEFLYTTRNQISRLGPTLKIDSDDLCLNIFVSSCMNCTMSFLMMENGTRTFIEQRELKKSGEWTLVRLTKEKVLADHVTIFIQTSYKPNVEESNGFWAIDDVRLCHKNEIKINLLKSTAGGDANEISCQIVDRPNLRPEKIIYQAREEYPVVESETDSKSINLTWTQDKHDKNMKYFIRYQGNDLCPIPALNSKRLRSNGFIVTTSNRVVLENLIPYTLYNIAFSSMINLTEKMYTLSTNESAYMSLNELPNRIRIDDVTDTTAKISWDKVDCEEAYGRIIYTLELRKGNSSEVVNLGVQSDNSKEMRNLQPNTWYYLNIITSRSDKVAKFNRTIPFMTKPGLASAPKNLEIYATSENSISVRYDLPAKEEGQPVEVHINRCNPLTLRKCKSRQVAVTPCELFAGKYCLEIPNLIPHQQHVLKISLKNKGTHTFGEEVVVEGKTEERVPGAPTNITYKLVDCAAAVERCNLNVNWIHPYDQNGTITAFNIFLNSSDMEFKGGFEGIYNIIDQNYLPKYTYQLKNLPYSTKYNLYIQSINEKYKSDFTTQVVVHTANLGDGIDQSPLLVETMENSAEFELRPPDKRLSTTLTVIIQDFNETQSVDQKIANEIELADNLCNDFGDTWISQTLQITNATRKIKLGKLDKSGKPLKPGTKYCVTFLMDNEYRKKSHLNVYYEEFTTLPQMEEKNDSIVVYLLILLAFVILALGLIYFVWYLRKKKSSKRPSVKTLDMDEHEYESLPFEDTVVHNNMYNHLEHK